ncbi:hypothetical protein TraAM80_02580 [Trypanosoma rangeli]|uniref:Uncharacterized protein n=1 Tax=Trypanosoma rangeli TaxID=5698 RepID=A0A422NTD2_TRYRA|nr:uncharacterized protein TraAM80_02580 [Trypanosoma rangeli]RNF08737.1 hypothetical protein TraAM80_02580 [Trypanosoma rangeli]|eukprot:RNF08737.1 hypothetical protein TraAM80_02580 [Trypanosoma rangeli]
MQSLEEQLDALWEESRVKRRAKVDELNTALVQRVRSDVDATLQKVRSVLASEQPEMERQIDRLLHMIDELAAGVEMWRQKAMSSMDCIDKEQKALGSMVQEVSIRAAARKEDMLKRQKQRSEEVRAACMELFKEVELKL